MITNEIEVVEYAVKCAKTKYSDFHSPHEGYAIIHEELDELWDEVKLKNTNYSHMYTEASHVACTAIRFMEMCKQKCKDIR